MFKKDFGPLFSLSEKGAVLSKSEENQFSLKFKDYSLYWNGDSEKFPEGCSLDAYDFVKSIEKEKVTAKDEFSVSKGKITFADGSEKELKEAENSPDDDISSDNIVALKTNLSENLKFVCGGTTNLIEAYPELEDVFLMNVNSSVCLISSNMSSVSVFNLYETTEKELSYLVNADSLTNIAKLAAFFKDEEFNVAIAHDENKQKYLYIASDNFEAVVKIENKQFPINLVGKLDIPCETITISETVQNLKKSLTEERKKLPSALQKYFGVPASITDEGLFFGGSKIAETENASNRYVLAGADLLRLLSVYSVKGSDCFVDVGCDNGKNVFTSGSIFLITKGE